ncbi:efflux RND transporter periplasmic adaptor subunit [Inquilinus limosus]|uniref:Efflux transporter periplasmic adaptor subunit n=1 Tax=Inquilinus limosus TaxID=171674 RepID=A0A211ZJM8_9PROT|nr:efflux RND transporter periplasmic adaptor subunit [Inquilinus limosus]OWJ65277.1 efflux transporter periplasmic adaptor subunit [Inquilinus limosus]
MMTRRLQTRPGRVLGTLAALGTVAFLAACNESGSSQAQSAPPPPPVTVASPLVKKITEYDEFTGRYEATARVEVRARVSGYLQSINFADGAMVKQGDVLFTIDPRPYQATVDSAKADLTSAQARLDLAKVQLDRASSLVAQSNVSRSSYDQAVQERRAAEAAVAQTTAALQSAQLNLDFTQVKAPMAGRVSNRRVDIGNLVTGDPSSTLLTTIVALDPIYFEFDMSEADYLAYQRAVVAGKLPSTRDNQTLIQTRLPDEQEWPHAGTMNFVDNQLDPGSGTIRARAILDNKDLFITPGQFGRIRLPGSNEYDAVLIPDSAILTDQSNRIVMTVKDDGTVEPKIIRPGPTQPGGLRIVREGLTGQDKVIINGLVRARPGGKVTPQPGKIEPAPEYDAN